MVSVIFAVLGVSFGALTTVVKLTWKFLTLILDKAQYTLYVIDGRELHDAYSSDLDQQVLNTRHPPKMSFLGV